MAQLVACLLWKQEVLGSSPSTQTKFALLVELADTLALEASSYGSEGSSPSRGTMGCELGFKTALQADSAEFDSLAIHQAPLS